MRSELSRHRLVHIRDNIRLALHFVANMDYIQFRDDIRTVYAVIRCLEIISEASRGVDPEVSPASGTALDRYGGSRQHLPSCAAGIACGDRSRT
jgi:uncharacterized protein with HEPN domain